MSNLLNGEIITEILDFYKIIKRRAVLIIAMTVLTTVAGALTSFYVIRPVYESKATLIIGNGLGEKTTESDVIMFQSLLKTYASIAESNIVSELAANKLLTGKTAEEIAKQRSISIESGTQILIIAVSSHSAIDAAYTANALTEAFIQESAAVMSTGTVHVLDKARQSLKPISPDIVLNISVAFLLGIIFALALVYLLESLDKSVKTEEDIERHLNIQIIGVIPKA